MERRQLHANDYTIGWVCALPVELAAATVMLDETHQPPQQDEDSLSTAIDPNLYTVGRMGEHNVVLVCLPAGQIGTNPAAAVATWMQYKFPCVRLGLMVGIGGGVPITTSANADVRLGDVVISQPYAGHGGVVHYDFGKTGPEGKIRPTGFLNAPPLVLLSATAKLQSNSYLDSDHLAAHLARFDGLEPFAREHAGEDVLFQPAYQHVGGPTCDGCSREMAVQRPRRALALRHGIVTHCGTVASGNQVMKDGLTRDRLSAELGGVLCFEMEAAGLMYSFPCLVIRGICDYADSHKNKTWQPYAAATAAACAKEILRLVPATEASKLRTAEEARRQEQKDWQAASSAPSASVPTCFSHAVRDGSFHQAAREGNVTAMFAFASLPDFDIDAKNPEGRTALHLMAMEGYDAAVLWLLNRGAQVEAECDAGSRALHYAAAAGHEKVILHLHRKGVQLEAANANGQTPLHVAASQGHGDIVRTLLRLGSRIEAHDDQGMSPVHAAILNNQPAMVQLLLKSHANINATSHSGDTPLHLAARNGLSTFTYLLAWSKAKLQPQNAQGETPLDTATRHNHQLDACVIQCETNRRMDHQNWNILQQAAFDGNIRVAKFVLESTLVRVDQIGADTASTPLRIALERRHHELALLLLDKGADVTAQPWGESKILLAVAAERGDVAMVQLLLDKGASNAQVHPSLFFKPEHSPLHLASSQGHVSVVRLLLDNSFDADPVDEKVNSALYLAVVGSEEKHRRVIEVLLKRGADINRWAHDLIRRRTTALLTALGDSYAGSNAEQRRTMISFLLEKGADVNLIGDQGHNAIYLAARIGDPAIVRMLLDRGVNYNDKEAMKYAVEEGHMEMIEMLFQAGANPLQLASQNRTLLHIVASKRGTKYAAVCDGLIKAGVSLNAKDAQGRTALHVAAENQNAAIVRKLIEHGASVSLRDRKGNSALDLSKSNRNSGVRWKTTPDPKAWEQDSDLVISYLEAAVSKQHTVEEEQPQSWCKVS